MKMFQMSLVYAFKKANMSLAYFHLSVVSQKVKGMVYFS